MNRTSLKEYFLKLQPLTPVYIGCGEQVEPYQYTISEGKYYKLDFKSLMDSLDTEKKHELVNKMNQGLTELRSYVDKLGWQDHVSYLADVTGSFAVEYNDKLNQKNNQLLVERFIKSLTRPYIPGSSLKGALRTAYLNVKGENVSFSVNRSKRGRINVIDGFKKAREIEKKILNYHSFFGDPFQTIKITDSDFKEDILKVYDTVVANFKKDKYSSGPPLYKESLVSLLADNRSYYLSFQLRIDRGRQKHKSRQNNINLQINIKDLFEVSRKFSQHLIETELDFFSNRKGGKRLKRVYKILQRIHGSLKDNEALVRLGGGVGYNAVSLNEANQKETVTTVSRVLAQEKFPYGWVLISYHGKDDGKVQLKETDYRETKESI